MALQTSYEDQRGTTYTASYWRVVRLVIVKEPEEAEIYVWVYADAATRKLTPSSLVVQFVYKISGVDWRTYFAVTVQDLLDKNMIKSSYEYLKTLPKFRGAVDV